MDAAASVQGHTHHTTRLEQVTNAMDYYTDGTTMDTGGKVDLSQHWSTPTDLVEILRQKLALRREWFASALNYNPVFDRSYLARKEDANFGLKFDAYSQIGEQGAHYGYATPEYKSKAMHEMVDAIEKIMATEEPVRIVSIAPSTKRWAFARRAQQQGAQELCIFEPGTLCFQAASYQTTSTIRSWGAIMKRVVVHLWSNAAGRTSETEIQNIKTALDQWKSNHVAQLQNAK